MTAKIEYLILLLAAFAQHLHISEQDAFVYLKKYQAINLCDKHYPIMHTFSTEDNIETLLQFCRRKGGSL